MANQTSKSVLSNLKSVHNLHTSGEILSFLRDIRENLSVVDDFSNKVNEKLSNLKKVEQKVQEVKVEEKPAVEVKKVSKEQEEKQKLEDKKLFQQQMETLIKKKPAQNPQANKNNNRNNPNFQNNQNSQQNKNFANKPFSNNKTFDQKRNFDGTRQKPNFNNGQRPFQNNPNGNRYGNNFNNNGINSNNNRFGNNYNNNGNNNRYGNNTNNNNGFNNNYNNNRYGNNTNNNRFNNGSNFANNRPNFNNGQRPFGQRPPFNKPQFSSTRANSFKNFEPAPTERLIVQQERNYGNKNKSGYRDMDDKRQYNKRLMQRRGYIDLDEDNEERVSFRKLVKPKKKSDVFVAPNVTNAVITTDVLSVKTLSEKIGKAVPEIIKKLMLLGIMATINSTIDFATAELVANELGITLEQKVEATYEEKMIKSSKEEQDIHAIKRPPVVAVMGHVDHGKTSLLDAIRKTNIAKGEAGGITQKIGAYTITTNNEKITFIDTPGHAAFTAMRARGAKITDIAILVVAGDDGIMPQTIEAINHIKAANVPMIVAVNKMDVPGANLERVKSGLAENGVLPEDWGGDAIVVPISAKTGVGIDKLIESILLLAEIQELKANPNKMATGTIIEAELDKNRGPIATILVQSGTLKVGDSIMSGLTFGKVRAMFNENGKQMKEATPSTPVSILGFYDVPNSGEQVFAVDEKLSKNVITERKNKLKEEQAKKTSGVSLDDFMDRVNEGKLKSLNIIIKADTQGSVEALKQTLTEIKNEEVKVSCIHSAVGNVSESDLVLAEASSAVIINFNIKVLPKIQTMADRMKVEIKQYNVIYDIVEDITNAINGMLTIKYEQVVAGHAEVRAVFKLSTNGLVAGSYVTDGKIVRSGMARLIRDGEVVADTPIVALKIVKDDKSEIASGFECGIKLKEVPNLKEGDIIECYELVPIKRV